MWQDVVIMTVQWGFVLFLIPAALHPTEKPPFLTSLLTAIGLFVIGGSLFTLGFLWSTISACAVATMWSVLAFQRWRMNRKSGESLLTWR